MINTKGGTIMKWNKLFFFYFFLEKRTKRKVGRSILFGSVQPSHTTNNKPVIINNRLHFFMPSRHAGYVFKQYKHRHFFIVRLTKNKE